MSTTVSYQENIYKTLSTAIITNNKIVQTNKWISHTKITNSWSEAELQAHLRSGRITMRESSTPGVYEYKDNQDLSSIKTIDKQKSLKGSQKTQVGEDEVAEFQALYDSCVLGLTDNSFEVGEFAWTETVSSLALVQPLCKAKAKACPKGKGKGGTPQEPAEELDEEAAETACLSKGKACLALLGKTLLALEIHAAAVRKSLFMTKTLKDKYAAMASDLQSHLDKIKKGIMTDKHITATMPAFKQDLTNAVLAVKVCQDFIRQHKSFGAPSHKGE